MHGLESTGVNKIGRSVSLRLANKTNFHKPKSSEFDSQHGKNLPLAELLLRVQNQDSWMFDRPSLYERRMKRKTQMAEAGQQQQQQQQKQQRQQLQSQQQRLQRRQQGLESGSKAAGLAVASSNRDSRTLTSAGTDSRLTKPPSATATTPSPSSLPATTMTTTATTKTNPERHPQRARTAKPALPPKPKAFPASSVQPPSSSSSSLPSLENSKSMGRNNQVADSSSKIKEKTSPKVASSSSSSLTVPSINATPSTSEGCTLVLPRAELPSRFKRLLFKTPPRISSKHVERPKRLSILREANDDDDNDDGGGDDDDDNDDGNDNAGITGEEEDDDDDDDDGAGGRKKKEIMHHNFKRNNITTNGGKIMDGGYDDDPEKYKTDLLKTLEWIQEELQQLKVKDRSLFRSLLATGNEILKLRAQDGTNNNNNNSCDSQHQSSVDLSPSSVNISGQAEAEDSPVFH